MLDPAPCAAHGPQRRLMPLAAAVIAVVAIIWLGSIVGTTFFGSGVASRLAGQGVAEIHVTGDAIYLGTIVSDRDGYLRLAQPAILIPDADSDTAGPQLLVQLLILDPYDLAGDVLIASDQVTLVGPVIPGSGLEQAYRQATGQTTSESPTASPH